MWFLQRQILIKTKKGPNNVWTFCGEYRIRTDRLPDCHRDALVLTYDQIFDILSTFHFFNLLFPLECSTSGFENFEIFYFPIFGNFSICTPAIQMIIQSFLNVFTRTNIVFVNCFRIDNVSIVHMFL